MTWGMVVNRRSFVKGIGAAMVALNLMLIPETELPKQLTTDKWHHACSVVVNKTGRAVYLHDGHQTQQSRVEV